MEQSFQEKVQSMTAKEIIMAMVNGLKHEWTKISMSTFGDVFDNVCFGCAATNAVCEIRQKPYLKEFLVDRTSRAEGLGTSYSFLEGFEIAIDNLRSGSVHDYNLYAKLGMFARIELPPEFYLPRLTSYDWKVNIGYYTELANAQP